MSNDKSNWNDEYKMFSEGTPKTPPKHLTVPFKKAVLKELNPSLQLVFAKLFAIHFISGTLTLFFCPQFGFAFHGTDGPLLAAFLRLGEYGCMIACGGLFVGATALVAALTLKAPEVRAIKRSRWLQWALLAFLSLGFFLSFREQESTIPLGLAAAWMTGALAGGISVFQGTYFLRMYVKERFILGG